MILMAAAVLFTIGAAAQPGGRNGARQGHPGQKQDRKLPTVEEEAQHKTDKMVSELNLTPKQAKKLLSYNKKDIKYRRENFPMEGHRGHRPDGLGPGGERPQGGRPQGGRPEGMGPGGMGPGGGHPQGGRPDGMGPGGGKPREIDFEALDKYNAKQEKKLRKIIGDEKFEQWNASHPQRGPKLPDPEFTEPDNK